MHRGQVLAGLIVPGLPQLALGTPTGPWKKLAEAMKSAGELLRARSPDLLVVFSTQWVSVLGHLVQADPNPRGFHVDENWHDLGDLPFDLKVDVEMATAAVKFAEGAGLQARTVDYPGFPIDTGTLVALKLLDATGSLPVVPVACNIYSGKEEELKLGKAIQDAICLLGHRVIVVASTLLSGHLSRENVEADKDRFLYQKDDQWNRRMLDLLVMRRRAEAIDFAEEFAKETTADMQFKALY